MPARACENAGEAPGQKIARVGKAGRFGYGFPRDMKALACLVFILAAARICAVAAPLDDLQSPDPSKRAAAAKILRVTYKPPPRAKWEPLLAALKPGVGLKTVADQMARYHVPFKPHFDRYLAIASNQLDDGWYLVCVLEGHNQPPVLTGATLSADIQGFWFEPPRTFTGTWITYYANGRKNIEGQYRNGRLEGTLTGYLSDGTLNWLGRYEAGACTDENYYYPSGRLKTRTLHTAQSDDITYFRENGSIASMATEPNNGIPHPELPGP